MNTINKINKIIIDAEELSYDAEIDTLYADGVEVGNADTMTRELMLTLADESCHTDDDETLFDALVIATIAKAKGGAA